MQPCVVSQRTGNQLPPPREDPHPPTPASFLLAHGTHAADNQYREKAICPLDGCLPASSAYASLLGWIPPPPTHPIIYIYIYIPGPPRGGT